MRTILTTAPLAVPLCALALLAPMGSRPAAAAPDDSIRTMNEFLGRGTPTFVRGTLGDDAGDARVANQVELLRGMLFPDAPVVDDVSIETAKGPPAWPRNPVLFGGAHVSAVVKALGPVLPFEAGPGRITVKDRVFEGEEHRLIVLVPPRAHDDQGPAHPAFLLYAGAGSPGVTEINNVFHGGEGLLVADRFGPLVRGQWELVAGTSPKLVLGTPAPRGGWSPGAEGTREDAATAAVSFFHRRGKGEPGLDTLMAERQQEQACLDGITISLGRLGLASVDPAFRVYLYPDAKVKRELTGRSADGHADLLSRTIHVRGADLANLRALELLMAHEATHVLADAWGPVATPLVGEGLAVWASGHYGGRALADWKGQLPAQRPKLADLLGPGFRRVPEGVSYPHAGLIVDALMELVGRDKIRAHFFGATRATWAKACEAAGTTPEAVEKAWHTRVGG